MLAMRVVDRSQPALRPLVARPRVISNELQLPLAAAYIGCEMLGIPPGALVVFGKEQNIEYI